MNEIENQLLYLAELIDNNQEEYKNNFLEVFNMQVSDLVPNILGFLKVKNELKNDSIKIAEIVTLANKINILTEKERPHRSHNNDLILNEDFSRFEEKYKLNLMEMIQYILYIDLLSGKEFDADNKYANIINSLIQESNISFMDAVLLINSIKESEKFNYISQKIYKKSGINTDAFRKLITYIVANFTKFDNQFYINIVKNVLYKIDYNDYLIEQNYIYNYYRNLVISDNKRKNIIIEPSIFFVHKWIYDEEVFGKKVVFAFEKDEIRRFVELAYSNINKSSNISFRTISDLNNSVDDKDKYNLLFFANHYERDSKKKKRIISDILSYISTGFRINIYDYDNDLFGYKTPFADYVFLENAIDVKKVYLLPGGINDSTIPEKKTFLIGDNCTSEDLSDQISIFKYSLRIKNKTQSLYRVGFACNVAKENLFNTKQKIRSFYREKYNEYVLKGERKGISGLYKLSPEISLYVWHENISEKDKIRIRCSIVDPKHIDKKRKKPICIAGTEKEVSNLNPKSLEDWLKHIYPYSIIKRKQDKENNSPRSASAEILQKSFKNKPISFKTIMFIYPEIDSLIKNYETIYSYLAETDFFEIRVDLLENEYITDVINYLFDPYNNATYYEEAQKFIFELLEFAKQKGHLNKNTYADVYKNMNTDKKAFRQVSDALLKRYLTSDEASKVYKYIIKSIQTKRDDVYLGVLIKLLTGLDTTIVCALKWKDFQEVVVDEKTSFFQLVVRRKVNFDGYGFSPLSKKNDYRIIPCSDELSHYLVNKREEVMKANNLDDIKEIDELSILHSDNSINAYSHGLSPEKLNKAARSILSKVCNYLDDKYIHTQRGRKKINFSRYKGDIFRSNYRHHSISNCGFSEGEVDYLLGNKPSSTFSLNYCDYENDCSQVLLLLKQNRLSNLFKNESDSINKQTIRNESFSFMSNKHLKHHENIIIDIKGIRDGVVDLSIDNEYGFDLEITEYDNETNI